MVIAPESVPDPDAVSFALAGISMELDALDASAASPFPPGTGLLQGEVPSGKPLPATRQGMSAEGGGEDEGKNPLIWSFSSATPLPVIDVGRGGGEIAESVVAALPGRSAYPNPSESEAGSPPFAPVGIADVDAGPRNGRTLTDTRLYGAGSADTIGVIPVFPAGISTGTRVSDVASSEVPGCEPAHPGAGSGTHPLGTLGSAGVGARALGTDIQSTSGGAEVSRSAPGAQRSQEASRPAAGTADAPFSPDVRTPADTVLPEGRMSTLSGGSTGLFSGAAVRGLDAMPADVIGAGTTAGPRALSGPQTGPAGSVAPTGIAGTPTAAETRSGPEVSVGALSLQDIPEGTLSGGPLSEGAGRASGGAPSSAATVRPDAGVFLVGTEAEPSDTDARGMAATNPVAADPAQRAMDAPAARSVLDTVIPSDTLRPSAPSPRAPAPLATPALMSPIDAPAAPIIPTAAADASAGRMQPSETRVRAEPAAPVPASSIIPPTGMREVTDAQDLLPRPAPDGSIAVAPVQSATAHDVSGHKLSAPRPYTPEPPPSTVPPVATAVSGPGTPPSVVEATSLPAGDDRTLGASDDALSSLSGLSARGAPSEQGLPAPASFASTAVRAAEATAQTATLPQAPGSLPILLGAATGRLGEELGHRILWLSGHNLRSAEIQLDPPELGPLQIQVHSHRDGASIQFTAHTAAARDAVESNLPRLRELLEGSGLNLLDVNVAQQQQRGARSDRDARESGNPNARNRLSGIGQVGEAPAPARRSLGLVDDYA